MLNYFYTRIHWRLIIVFIPLLTSCMKSIALEEKFKTPVSIPLSRPYSNKEYLPVYNPPENVDSGGRLDAGTRLFQNNLPYALAPQKTGLTTQGSPVLYWYIEGKTSDLIYFDLLDSLTKETLVNAKIPNSDHGGIQQIQLTKLKVELSLGRSYMWSISLRKNEQGDDKDLKTGGSIQRVPITPSLDLRLENEVEDEINVLAEEGFWYDAFMAATKILEISPNDQRNKYIHASLLDQVDRKEIVDALYF